MSKGWHIRFAAAVLLSATVTIPATAEDVVYRIDRTFDPTDTTIGDATVFNIVNSANTNLTGIIIGKYSITTNDQSATEREGVSWGQTSTTQAWQNVTNALTIGSYSNIFDDPGWIKGVKTVTLNGKTTYGAYMWWLQNTLEFTTPGSTYWTNAGCTYVLENVLVGTLGDYAPGTQYAETFPTRDDPDATNWPGCPFLTSEMPASNQTVKYSFRTDTYYELLDVQIRAQDGRPPPKCVPYNDDWQRLRCVVTPDKPGVCYWEMLPGSTNAEVQWGWAQQPITAFSTSGHSATRDYQVIQLKYSPNDSSTTATVQHAFTIVEVVYSAAEDQLYGFDSTTNPPWKSVEKDWTDTVIARVYPTVGIYSNVFYTSTDEGKVTTSPGQGTASYQTLTIGGSNKTETTTVEARLEATNGPSAGDLKVWCNCLNTNTKMKVIVVNDSVHGLTAGTVSASGLKTWLNDGVFIQAVLEFNEVALVTNDVSYDIVKQDDKLEYGIANAEYAAITNLMDPVYDINVFIVNSSTSNGLMGFAPTQEKQPAKPKICFIMSDRTTEDGARHWTIGHETGHGLFGLGHHDGVPGALMYPHWDKYNWGVWLNHEDWEDINPVADD